MSDRLELLRHLWRKDAPVPTRPVATIPFGDGMWWRGGFHLDERGRAKIAGFCRPVPYVGDIVTVAMASGRTALFRVPAEGYDWPSDPGDLFFAIIEFIEYAATEENTDG